MDYVKWDSISYYTTIGIRYDMSKHEYTQDYSPLARDTLHGQTDIARELEEANRLKRLEISLNHGLITSKKQLKDELEDKA